MGYSSWSIGILGGVACGAASDGSDLSLRRRPLSSPELCRIGILNAAVSHFRQVEAAAKAPFGYHKIISRKE